MSLTQSTAPALQAFGYKPEFLPHPSLHGKSLTFKQAGKLRHLYREWNLEEWDVPFLRAVVMEAYGQENKGSAFEASLFIDFLMNANDEAFDAAMNAATFYEPPVPARRPGWPIIEDVYDPYA